MNQLRIILLSFVLMGLCHGQATKTPPRDKPVSEGHRYLFVVEVSKNMDRYRESLLETALDLVGTGMHGDMRTGDAFTIWLYRDRVGTNLFRPEMWFADMREQQSQAAGEFISKLRYDAKADLNLAMDEVMKVVASSKSVTVFMINDGSLGMAGTPFDLYANTFYREQSSEFRKQNKPFVTAFLAAEGKIIDCIISPGGREVKVPQVPESLRRKAEYAKPAPQPAPAPIAPKSKAAVVQQPARSATTPPTSGSTKPQVSAEPPRLGSVQMSLGHLTPRSIPVPVAEQPAPAATAATPKATVENLVKPQTAATTQIEPLIEETAGTSGGPMPRLWLIALAGGFLLCAAWIVWVMVRVLRPSRGPSLITRSLETPTPQTAR